MIQLGLLVLGLVILLSFRSDIADGAAGCFSNIASSDDADATTRPDAAPTAPAEVVTPPEAEELPPSVGTPVEVKVVHLRSGDAGAADDADATGAAAGEGDAEGGADAVPAASGDAGEAAVDRDVRATGDAGPEPRPADAGAPEGAAGAAR